MDDDGCSVGPGGQSIDPSSYVKRRGVATLDPERDAAYTRDLGEVLVERYRKETVLMSTALVAHVLWRRIVAQTPGADLFTRLRMRGDVSMKRSELESELGVLRDRLVAIQSRGEVRVNEWLMDAEPSAIVDRALRVWNGYHTRMAAQGLGHGGHRRGPLAFALLPEPDGAVRRRGRGSRASGRCEHHRAHGIASMSGQATKSAGDHGADGLPRVGVVGGGGFGRAMARALHRNGRHVVLWSRQKTPSEHVTVTTDLADLADAELIFFAVPSPHVDATATALGAHLNGSHLLVHVSRGLVGEELATLSQVLKVRTPCRRIGALAGPLDAEALADGEPTGAIVGTRFPEVTAAVREALDTDSLRTYESRDIVGVEIASAVVGYLALAVGVGRELQISPATVAVLLTRGMNEATRWAPTLGADPSTFYGLAGQGDLLSVMGGDVRPEVRLGRALARGADLSTASRKRAHTSKACPSLGGSPTMPSASVYTRPSPQPSQTWPPESAAPRRQWGLSWRGPLVRSKESSMTTVWSFPTRILFGEDAADTLPAELKALGGTKAFFVTDQGVRGAGLVDPLVTALVEAGVESVIFDALSSNPLETEVLSAKDAYIAAGADCIVAVGGGSPIDVAKIVRLASTHPLPLAQYDDAIGGDAKVTHDVPPMIAIPTTAGTGSEVGRSGVVTLQATNKKTVIFSPKLLPNVAILDPKLTESMPPRTTAATGMDALTHLVEAYCSKGDHPMADAIALEGIRLCGEYLERSVHDGKDLEARGGMLKASMMGAVAFQKGPRGLSFTGASAERRAQPAPRLGQRALLARSVGLQSQRSARAHRARRQALGCPR